MSLRSLSFARVPGVCRVATSMIVRVRLPSPQTRWPTRRTRCGAVAPRRSRGRRTLVTVRLQRQVVDYALRRRSLLAEVYSGRTGVSEVCDANPYLLRAAKFHGKPSSVMCPICRKEQLTLVSWVFGDHLGAVSGSARTAEELVLLATRFDEFSVHVVEVCRTCSWNHLVKSYVLGAVPPPKGSRGRDGTDGAQSARARPVNSEGRHDRSASDVRAGQAADGVGARSRTRRRPCDACRRRPAAASRAPAVPPDDRRTAVLPPVRDDTPPHLRDPIDAVKAALDGTPPPPKHATAAAAAAPTAAAADRRWQGRHRRRRPACASRSTGSGCAAGCTPRWPC